MLTNKENVADIVNLCISGNFASVALDAINKCFGYYPELGPESRIAVFCLVASVTVDVAESR